MRTGRSLTVCWGLLPRGGWLSAPGGSAPGGGVCSGGCLVQGGSARGGGYIPACTEADTPPPLWTDNCLWKYYLGPTSLRPVINKAMLLILHHSVLQSEGGCWCCLISFTRVLTHDSNTAEVELEFCNWVWVWVWGQISLHSFTLIYICQQTVKN